MPLSGSCVNQLNKDLKNITFGANFQGKGEVISQYPELLF